MSAPRTLARPALLALAAVLLAPPDAARCAEPARPAVSFRNEVLPLLAKHGCSSASCHGSPRGRGELKLSIWGVDPAVDIDVLARQAFGRRVDLVAPQASLLLLKPTSQVVHGGGQRFRRDELPARVLTEWIGQGARDDAGAPQCVRLEVLPAGPDLVLRGRSATADLSARAVFADGTSRDVTAFAAFGSSAEDVARVDHDGHVVWRGRGEAAINVRFQTHLVTRYATCVPDSPPPTWKTPPPAGLVDEHVFARLTKLGIEPSPPCSDDEFLRRVHLDVVGRLPSVETVRSFLDDRSPDKRTKTIDALLAGPDHARYWALRWADQFRVTKNRLGRAPAVAFYEWIAQALAENRSYDAFARDLLLASGSTQQHAPANYFQIGDDEYELMEATSRVFLGTQIQCARCHNHPFERWTQTDYHGLRHFFHRVDRQTKKEGEESLVSLAPATPVVNPDTGLEVRPWLPLAGRVELDAEVDPREPFVRWLASAENPFFAKVEVNRIWAWLLGRGLVDPPDDFRETNPPAHPALLEALAADFAAHGFDRRRTIRTVLVSRTYQASVRWTETNREDVRFCSRYLSRRLDAEQLLDAVAHLTGVPEQFAGLPAGTPATQLPAPDLVDHEFLKFFGQPARAVTCACERPEDSNLGEALQLYNGRTVNDKLQNRSNRVHAALKAGRTDAEIVEELFLAAYCRRPRPAETERIVAYVARHRDRATAFEDVVWAILNTNEFLSQH